MEGRFIYAGTPGTADRDGDGVPDASDNCRDTSNPAQEDTDGNDIGDVCDELPGGGQLPGDCNQDGELDLADGVCILGVLFVGNPPEFPCGDGLPTDPANLTLIDREPDGRIRLTDGIALLQFLFADGRPHPLVLAADATACIRISGCPDHAACR